MERYDLLKERMELTLRDLAGLSGTIVGEAPWQEAAQTAAKNLRALSELLGRIGTDQWRLNKLEGPVVFPCPLEILEDIVNE